MMRKLALLVLAVSLVSCGQAPQVPADHYYRLTLPSATKDRKRVTESPVIVDIFQAEGLYNDRAVLYSDDEHPGELQEHRYYFWYTSPPRMLRDYLLQFLRDADAAPVIMDSGEEDYLRISGKLQQFERHQSPAGSSVNVALELRVDGPDTSLPLLLRQYRASVPIEGKDMTGVVSGFNSAVDKIYTEFLGDLAAALKKP